MGFTLWQTIVPACSCVHVATSFCCAAAAIAASATAAAPARYAAGQDSKPGAPQRYQRSQRQRECAPRSTATQPRWTASRQLREAQGSSPSEPECSTDFMRDSVRRVLAQAGLSELAPPRRPRRVDPYRAFILQTLARFPTLTAVRLFVMVHERGYSGSLEQLPPCLSPGCGRGPRPRRPGGCARLRSSRRKPTVALRPSADRRRTSTADGLRMVLSYSRRIFLHFVLDARMDSFLHGHVEDRARTRARRRALQPRVAGVRRPSSLRATPGGRGARVS